LRIDSAASFAAVFVVWQDFRLKVNLPNFRVAAGLVLVLVFLAMFDFNFYLKNR